MAMPNCSSTVVDTPRRLAFEHHALRLARVALHHAVADEAVADARQHRRLAQRTASSIAVRMACAELACRRTTSSSGITLAGEKKCRPITSCGRVTDAAISSMSSVEVLVASIAPGLATASSLANTSFLRSMLFEHGLDDHVARRQGRRTPACRVISAMRRAFSAGSMRPRFTMLSKVAFDDRESAVRTRGSTSSSVTGMPAFAKHIAMPPPIVPAADDSAGLAPAAAFASGGSLGDLAASRVPRRTRGSAPSPRRSPWSRWRAASRIETGLAMAAALKQSPPRLRSSGAAPVRVLPRCAASWIAR